jgi:hypothetical protein
MKAELKPIVRRWSDGLIRGAIISDAGDPLGGDMYRKFAMITAIDELMALGVDDQDEIGRLLDVAWRYGRMRDQPRLKAVAS